MLITVLRRMALCLLLAGAVPASRAALFTFDSRGLFDAVHPGLAVEDFEEALIADGTYQVVPGPIDAATNNGIFSPGDILAGLSINDAPPGPDDDEMIVGGTGFFPGSTKAVFNNTFADSLDLIFSPGTSAVGFDLAHATAPGALGSGTMTIEVFGSGGSLGILTPSISGIGFFGVFSDGDPITRINILSATNAVEYVDNVAFEADSEVPEPSAGLLAALGLGALLGMRRRRR